MAAYHIRQSIRAKTTTERNSHLDQATIFFNQSDRINIQSKSTWLGKGYLLFVRGKLEPASYQFKISLDKDDKDILGLVGTSLIHLHRHNYMDALKGFQKALRYAPDSVPDVRVAMGVCFDRLQSWNLAQLCFEIALERVIF